MATARLGFKDVYIVPFLDSNFTLDEGNKQLISKAMLIADQGIVIEKNDKLQKYVFGDGSILTVTDANDTPGTITLQLGKTGGIDNILQYLFPESYKATDGSGDTVRSFTSPIGSDRTVWSKALLIRIVDSTDPDNKSKWITARCAVNTNYKEIAGKDLSTIDITFDMIGGETLSNGETEIMRIGDPDVAI